MHWAPFFQSKAKMKNISIIITHCRGHKECLKRVYFSDHFCWLNSVGCLVHWLVCPHFFVLDKFFFIFCTFWLIPLTLHIQKEKNCMTFHPNFHYIPNGCLTWEQICAWNYFFNFSSVYMKLPKLHILRNRSAWNNSNLIKSSFYLKKNLLKWGPDYTLIWPGKNNQHLQLWENIGFNLDMA